MMGYGLVKFCVSVCDECGIKGTWTKEIGVAVNHMRRSGWLIRGNGGSSGQCYCPECAKPYLQIMREQNAELRGRWKEKNSNQEHHV